MSDTNQSLLRQVRILQAIVAALIVIVLIGARKGDDVIRARGLVITDDNGRERIVIGAPAAKFDGRKRNDPVTGLIVLGDNGADRFVLGYTANPQVQGQVAQRIANAVGIEINDADGNERGGFGLLDNGRIVLGLDYPNREAVALFAEPNGFAGIMVSGEKGNQFERAGMVVDNKEGGAVFKLAAADNGERLFFHVAGDGKTRMLFLDEKREKQVDLVEKFKL